MGILFLNGNSKIIGCFTTLINKCCSAYLPTQSPHNTWGSPPASVQVSQGKPRLPLHSALTITHHVAQYLFTRHSIHCTLMHVTWTCRINRITVHVADRSSRRKSHCASLCVPPRTTIHLHDTPHIISRVVKSSIIKHKTGLKKFTFIQKVHIQKFTSGNRPKLHHAVILSH